MQQEIYWLFDENKHFLVEITDHWEHSNQIGILLKSHPKIYSIRNEIEGLNNESYEYVKTENGWSGTGLVYSQLNDEMLSKITPKQIQAFQQYEQDQITNIRSLILKNFQFFPTELQVKIDLQKVNTLNYEQLLVLENEWDTYHHNRIRPYMKKEYLYKIWFDKPPIDVYQIFAGLFFDTIDTDNIIVHVDPKDEGFCVHNSWGESLKESHKVKIWGDAKFQAFVDTKMEGY